MSDEGPNVRRLLLISPDDGSTARGPLGERHKIEGLLKELLPRSTFHSDGAGTFARNGKELRLQLVGDPVLAIEMELPTDGGGLIPTLERVVSKTGWKLFDPDHPETVISNAAPDAPARFALSPGQRRIALLAAIVLVIAGSLWWTIVGSREFMIAGDRDTGLKMIGTTTAPVPKAEEFTHQARIVGAYNARARALAPAFKSMRIVHELMIIQMAVLQARASVGNGNYVNPAMLVTDSSLPDFEGIRVLPSEFAEESRHGFRFEFIGSGEAKTLFEEFDPGYSSYVYVASPELQTAGPYTFAVISDSGRIHYRTDGSVPEASDPSVTDYAASPLPSAPNSAAANETGTQNWVSRLIDQFINNPEGREAEILRNEERAIQDLRAVQSAEHLFYVMFGRKGYAPLEVLSDASILAPRYGGVSAVLESHFAQRVRGGYEFIFEGARPVSDSGLTLYSDYRYVAIPVDGPRGRRSFSLTADGLIRFRRDGFTPQKDDTILGAEK